MVIMELVCLIITFTSVLVAAYLWGLIAFLITQAAIALFLAYIARDVQLDNELEAKERRAHDANMAKA